jgi:selenide,water dikinase
VEALAWDPQTSGGLLVAIPADRALAVEAAFGRAGLLAARVGSVEAGTGVELA